MTPERLQEIESQLKDVWAADVALRRAALGPLADEDYRRLLGNCKGAVNAWDAVSLRVAYELLAEVRRLQAQLEQEKWR